jgi:hypothetical protein
MKFRFYSKQELAMLYFPDSDPHAAVMKLMLWIRRNKELTAALETTHMSRYAKVFTPKQVKLIVEYLDEP